jgi:hypothetical protein
VDNGKLAVVYFVVVKDVVVVTAVVVVLESVVVERVVVFLEFWVSLILFLFLFQSTKMS